MIRNCPCGEVTIACVSSGEVCWEVLLPRHTWIRSSPAGRGPERLHAIQEQVGSGRGVGEEGKSVDGVGVGVGFGGWINLTTRARP